MTRPRFLFVDDDESIRQTLPVILTREGFECTTVAGVSEAIAEISRQRFEMLLSDLNIGEPRNMLRAHIAMTSSNFFSLLGSRPVIGRTFAPGDRAEGHGCRGYTGRSGRLFAIVVPRIALKIVRHGVKL